MYSIVLKDHTREQRDEFAKRLSSMGVDTRPFFYLMTEMPPYANHKRDNCNVALQLAQQGLNLPSSTLLKEDDIQYICECIKKCL
jgi:perosamine synthetase